MPTDGDFKRLVRARMSDTGERYTAARAALRAGDESSASDTIVSDRTRSLLGQLADVQLAGTSRAYLEQLPEDERRSAALEGLSHENWRVRRTCAQLLDRVDLTPQALAALTRAARDEHPQVRRKAVHTLSCEHCKPSGCLPDVKRVCEEAARDQSSIVRSMVVHVCSLHFFQYQWAVDVVATVAATDPSEKLRREAAASIEYLRLQWDSNERRRQLPPELVRKTERHAGHWIAIGDGRVVAVRNGQGRVFRRAVLAGATRYWVAPPGWTRPHIA